MNRLSLLKKVSLRGRFAIGLSILLEDVKALKVPIFKEKVLPEIAVYTNSHSLDEWHSIVEKLLPEYIIMLPYENVKHLLTEDEYLKLKKEYLEMEAYLIEVIESVVWVGIVTVYNSFSNANSESLEYLLDVFDKSKAVVNVDEIILKYKDFSIEKENGWGDCFTLTISE